MRVIAVFLLLVISPAGQLYAMSVFEPESIRHDAMQDADKAYQQGDRRLLGITTRGMSIPGIASDKIEVSKQRCGVRLIRRSDVVRSNEELQSRQDQAKYIEAYNQAMFKLCWLHD